MTYKLKDKEKFSKQHQAELIIYEATVKYLNAMKTAGKSFHPSKSYGNSMSKEQRKKTEAKKKNLPPDLTDIKPQKRLSIYERRNQRRDSPGTA